MTRNRKILIVINTVLVLLTTLGWIQSMFNAENQMLLSRGIDNLKYYTILSNILEGMASFVLLIPLLAGRKVPKPVYLLKYTATATVSVTFWVVMVFFTPMYGFVSMVSGANLWFHLVNPLIAIAEFVFLDHFGELKKIDAIWPVFATVLYGAVYAVNVVIHGVGEPGNWNDFYGFVNWGLPVGFGIFGAIVLLCWLCALVLCLGNRKAGAGVR